MNELWFWGRVRDAFNQQERTRLKKLPAEGFGGKGTPDGTYVVWGTQGYLELKYTKAWPRRHDTSVKIGEHGVSPEQRNWLEDWESCGGRVHVLFGIAQEWFLLKIGEVPPDSRTDRAQLMDVGASGRWGTMKDLKRLPTLLATQPVPVVN